MKKLFVMTLAVAALASCSKVEPIEPGYKSAIGFGKSFVDNTTKALIEDADDLLSFEVWGTENNVSIFDATVVSRTDNTKPWGYADARYWHAKSDYSFAAIAPAGHGGIVSKSAGLPTATTYTLAATDQVDLLYATAEVVDVEEDRDAPVEFSFAHQLAKVKFAITNGYPAGYTVEISNLAIKASKTAKVTFPGAWTEHANLTDPVTLSFTITNPIATGATGNSTENLIIPKGTDVVYTIEGTATVKLNDTEVKTINIAHNLADVLQAGHFYNITATIKSTNQIKFTVTEVTGWNNPATDVAM